jgi:Inward rectifier potassium channel C-terminal domain
MLQWLVLRCWCCVAGARIFEELHREVISRCAGDSFCVRRSYLASEIVWGHSFTPAVFKGSQSTRHTADLSRLNRIEPQPQLPRGCSPAEASRRVLASCVPQAHRSLPFPTLGANTLAVASVCTTFEEDGEIYLLFRVADTRIGQMVEAHVRAYLLQWHADGATALPKRYSTPYTLHVRPRGSRRLACGTQSATA